VTRVTVRLSEAQKQFLQEKASRQQMKLSDYIRDLVKQDLQGKTKQVSARQKLPINPSLTLVQTKIFELLYRSLFLNQVSFGRMFPDEHEEVQNMISEQAELALNNWLSEI